MPIQRHSRRTLHTAQRGFITGAILFGLLLLVIVVGALALTNRSGPSNADPEKSRVYASSVIEIGNNLKDSITRYSQDRPVAGMTLTTTAGTGLYDPALGLAQETDVPAAATLGGTTDVPFSLISSTDLTGVYGANNGATAVAAVGLGDAVCRQINKTLYGDSIDAAVPTTIGDRLEGCVSASGSDVYFKDVLPAGAIAPAKG